MTKNGFTLIELLIVVSLIITIGTMTTPFASGFLIRIYQESTVNSLISALHRAQSLSLDGKGNTEWGICKIGSVIRVYQGSCTTPTIKEDTNIPSTVTVTGLSDITFSRVTGEPSSTLSISITSGAGTKNITLNTLGVVDVN